MVIHQRKMTGNNAAMTNVFIGNKPLASRFFRANMLLLNLYNALNVFKAKTRLKGKISLSLCIVVCYA